MNYKSLKKCKINLKNTYIHNFVFLRRILSILRNNAYLRKAKKEMKIYYKGVLFRNWIKTIKKNSHDNKRKVSAFFYKRFYKKFFGMLKSNYLKNKQIKIKFNSILNKYLSKVKRTSFRTLRIETKYKEL